MVIAYTRRCTHLVLVTPGDRLREARENRGISQEELASRTGCRGQTIYRAEKNNSVPKGDLLVAIARELGVTSEWIITGAETEIQIESPHMYPAFDEWVREHGPKHSVDTVRILRERAFKYEPSVRQYTAMAQFIEDAIEGAADRIAESIEQHNQQVAESVKAKGGRKIEGV